MKKLLLNIIIGFTAFLFLDAQNQVPSFDVPVTCPISLGQSNLTPPWGVPVGHTGTPDYMHSCNSGLASVPSNGNGFQNPVSGSGYYGIITYGGNLREYLQVKLNQKLQKNSIYEIGMYVSLADKYKYASNNIGLYLSDNKLTGNANALPILANAQLISNSVVTDQVGWTMLTTTYLAEGIEEFIAVGNFTNDVATQNATVNASSNFEFAYYYLDNIFVRKIGEIFWVDGDTAICSGDTAIVESHGSVSYSWAEAANPSVIIDNDSVLIVSPASTTTYLAYGIADTISHTIYVKSSPSISLGEDIDLCEGEVEVLDVYSTGATYLWSDGSQNSYIIIKGEGIYWVQATKNGCTSYDEVEVTLITVPGPDWEEIQFACEQTEYELDLSYLTGVTFMWPDGSANPTYTVGQPGGSYWVEIAINNCSKVFSTEVEFKELPVVNLPTDTVVCELDFLILGVTGEYNYQWSNGSNSRVTTVFEDGEYFVTASNECGSATSNIEVKFRECRCFTVIPNTFTPNNDGNNDYFSPLSNCKMTDFKFKIYHRSGKLVFQTSKPSVGWDGKFNLSQMPVGSYVYTVDYKYESSSEDKRTLSGSFNLIR